MLSSQEILHKIKQEIEKIDDSTIKSSFQFEITKMMKSGPIWIVFQEDSKFKYGYLSFDENGSTDKYSIQNKYALLQGFQDELSLLISVNQYSKDKIYSNSTIVKIVFKEKSKVLKVAKQNIIVTEDHAKTSEEVHHIVNGKVVLTQEREL